MSRRQRRSVRETRDGTDQCPPAVTDGCTCSRSSPDPSPGITPRHRRSLGDSIALIASGCAEFSTWAGDVNLRKPVLFLLFLLFRESGAGLSRPAQPPAEEGD